MATFYCNKCGYAGNAGPTHTRPSDAAMCNYYASRLPQFGGIDPKFCPGSNPDRPQEFPEQQFPNEAPPA